MMARPGARTTAIGVTSLIGAGTAIVSYKHAFDIVTATGNTGFIAYIIPLFADGLIFLCSTAFYASSQVKSQAKVSAGWAAWLGLIIGCCVTIAMNVLAGLSDGIGGALVGALTPVVLLIALRVLEHVLRNVPKSAPAARPRRCPHGLPGSVAEAAVTDYLHRRDCLGEQPTYGAVADAWRVDRRTLPKLVAAAAAPVAEASAEPDLPKVSLNGNGPHE